MASGPSEQISIGRALARLGVAAAFRQTMTIAHRGAAPITLKCRIVFDGDDFIETAPGITKERRVLRVIVTANQTNFQPATTDTELVLSGDIVTVSKYTGRSYQVVTPIELDDGGRVYTLHLVENKRLNSGAG